MIMLVTLTAVFCQATIWAVVGSQSAATMSRASSVRPPVREEGNETRSLSTDAPAANTETPTTSSGQIPEPPSSFGQIPGPPSSSFGQSPTTPFSSGQVPGPPASSVQLTGPQSSSDQVPSPPSISGQIPGPPSSSEQIPGPPSSSGQSPGPPSSSGQIPRPPSSPGQIPGPPSSSGLIPGPPSSPGQIPDPPSSSGQIPGPPSSSGQSPGPPSSSGQIDGPPSSSGQSPGPPSSSSGQIPAPPTWISSGDQLPASLTAGGEPSTPSSPKPKPQRPSVVAFFNSSLQKDCLNDTFDPMGFTWSQHIQLLKENILTEYPSHYLVNMYSCKERCDLSERNASIYYAAPRSAYESLCYCDHRCDSFGDCCYDFEVMCNDGAVRQTSTQTPNETCVAFQISKRTAQYHGYAAWNKCSMNWTDENIRHKCQHDNEADLLSNLPVFDANSHMTYRNAFCAKCNNVSNTTYWKLEVFCQRFNVSNINFTGINIVDLVQKYGCYMWRHPPAEQLQYLQRCIPRLQDCSIFARANNKSFCQGECLRYAFPVCYRGLGRRFLFRNPQCALCNGFQPSYLDRACISGSSPVFPSLTVLFDFQSTSEYRVGFRDKKGNILRSVEKQVSCLSDEVYDPYVDHCKQVESSVSYAGYESTKHNITMQSKGNQTEFNLNCTFLAFIKSEFETFPNGSVLLKPHRKMYSKTVFLLTEEGLLLCVNFTKNFTKKKEESQSMKITSTRGSLQLLTSIGGIISFISLILLLATYLLFAELRNLPGKIVINLTSSLLLYQLVFLFATDTSDKVRCLVVAVLLHFSSLVSFMWMNVMAFDIHRTFTSSGASQQDGQTKRLVKYSVYSFVTPVVIVVIAFVIDQVEEGIVGYGHGEEECFISRPLAKLFSFVLPVSLLMLYNVFALLHTLLHITRTRKRAVAVTNQRPSSSMTWICVKMVSVMGITWLLGVAANVQILWFLWYPFVVLNSLQGFFIFLSFAVSGRALELYKGKFRKAKKGADGPGTSSSTSNQGTQETRF